MNSLIQFPSTHTQQDGDRKKDLRAANDDTHLVCFTPLHIHDSVAVDDCNARHENRRGVDVLIGRMTKSRFMPLFQNRARCRPEHTGKELGWGSGITNELNFVPSSSGCLCGSHTSFVSHRAQKDWGGLNFSPPPALIFHFHQTPNRSVQTTHTVSHHPLVQHRFNGQATLECVDVSRGDVNLRVVLLRGS